MGGPKRDVHTLCHSFIFRNCFNFYHSTTPSHRKRAPKMTRKVTSNSGFVRSAISSHMQYAVITHATLSCIEVAVAVGRSCEVLTFIAKLVQKYIPRQPVRLKLTNCIQIYFRIHSRNENKEVFEV